MNSYLISVIIIYALIVLCVGIVKPSCFYSYKKDQFKMSFYLFCISLIITLYIFFYGIHVIRT